MQVFSRDLKDCLGSIWVFILILILMIFLYGYTFSLILKFKIYLTLQPLLTICLKVIKITWKWENYLKI